MEKDRKDMGQLYKAFPGGARLSLRLEEGRQRRKIEEKERIVGKETLSQPADPEGGEKVGNAIGTIGALASLGSLAGWLAGQISPEAATLVFVSGAVTAFIGFGISRFGREMRG